MKNKTKVKWLKEPEAHDYPAALSYLLLLFPENVAKNYVEQLKRAEMTSFKAKDISRASGLSLLGISNYHVKSNIKKINKGKKMTPLLLVRDEQKGKVIIADGYHRLCATYTFNEDESIPCKIV